MHSNHSPVVLRRLSIGLVFVAGLLLWGSYASNLSVARAQELPESTPTAPPEKPWASQMEALAVATPTPDIYEAGAGDDDFAHATIINDGNTQAHSIYPAADQDWLQFQLVTDSSILLETNGYPAGTVVMALYASDGTTLADPNPILGCAVETLTTGTYYVQVQGQTGSTTVPLYNIGIKVAPDTYEADCLSSQAKTIANNDTQVHDMSPSGDQDWTTFTLVDPSTAITLETSGTDPHGGDTEMWLYQQQPDTSLKQIDYNDDKNYNTWWSYLQRCGSTALTPGTYYARINKRGSISATTYNLTFKTNPMGSPTACDPNTRVMFNTAVQGSYWVHQETTTRLSYTGAPNGPVRVRTLDNNKRLIASEGISLKKTAGYESYSEFIGVPGSRAATTYWFPWYNYGTTSGLVTQVCFGNVGSASTNVTVTIGTTPHAYSGIGVNKAKCVSYPGVNAGPVKVRSSGVPIVASLGTRMKTNSTFTSYAEFGGLSTSGSLSTDYMFPFYSNPYSNPAPGTTASWLRFTNIGSSSTSVTVLIHGVPKWGPSTLTTSGVNQSKLVSIKVANDGPVHVQSSGSPISASMTVKLTNKAPYTSYTEVIGLPEGNAADTRVVFPWYNNTGDLLSQIRITNLGGSGTNVTVTIGGVTRQVVSLPARQSKVVSYANLNIGPVVLQSSSGGVIEASMMTYLKKNTGYTSYSEFIGQLGLPGNQLETSSWFPWYSNVSTGSFVSQLRLALAKPQP